MAIISVYKEFTSSSDSKSLGNVVKIALFFQKTNLNNSNTAITRTVGQLYP